jgi:hypothetical protein
MQAETAAEPTVRFMHLSHPDKEPLVLSRAAATFSSPLLTEMLADVEESTEVYTVPVAIGTYQALQWVVDFMAAAYANRFTAPFERMERPIRSMDPKDSLIPKWASDLMFRGDDTGTGLVFMCADVMELGNWLRMPLVWQGLAACRMALLFFNIGHGRLQQEAMAAKPDLKAEDVRQQNPQGWYNPTYPVVREGMEKHLPDRQHPAVKEGLAVFRQAAEAAIEAGLSPWLNDLEASRKKFAEEAAAAAARAAADDDDSEEEEVAAGAGAGAGAGVGAGVGAGAGAASGDVDAME